MRKVVHFQCLKDQDREAVEEANIVRAGKLRPGELTVIKAFQTPTNPRMCAGATHVTIGGSGWSVWEDIPFKRELRETILAATGEFQIPTLGICFGGQFLAELFGGTVIRDDARAERGKTHIEIEPHFDWLFKGHAPNGTVVRSSHHDRIVTLPPATRLLATSQAGAVIQAFKMCGFPCWGVQFHPERSRPGGDRVLENFFSL